VSFQAVVNLPNQSRPTGELGIMNDLGNPIPYATGPGVAISGNYGGGAYQQINVGDIMVQYQDATYGSIALPACVWTGTAATAVLASEAAMAAIHGNALASAGNIATANTTRGFLGLSQSYRDPNRSSYGKSSDRVSIAPSGRAKMRISPQDYNFNNAVPAGYLVAVAVNVTVVGSNTYSAVPFANQVQTTLVSTGTTAGSTVAASSAVVTAEYSIGRLAFDKAPGDTFVWVDILSSVLRGGVQEINTAS